jgi:hypothetical protein
MKVTVVGNLHNPPAAADNADGSCQTITEDGFRSFRDVAWIDENDITNFAESTSARTQDSNKITHDWEKSEDAGNMIVGLRLTSFLSITGIYSSLAFTKHCLL